jgi:hypothetical protein
LKFWGANLRGAERKKKKIEISSELNELEKTEEGPGLSTDQNKIKYNFTKSYLRFWTMKITLSRKIKRKLPIIGGQ